MGMDLQIMLTTPRTKSTPQNKQIIEDYIEVINGSQKDKVVELLGI